MVLGLRSKGKRITSIQVEYTVEVLEIKPWPVSQSLKSIRSVVLQWETGDKKFGLTKPMSPSLAEGKIEINETFRLHATLFKEILGKSNGSGGFHKNILQFYLHEPKKDKGVKGQLGNAVLDLAHHGIIKGCLTIGVPLNLKRSIRNIDQPVLYVNLQSFEKNGPESSSSCESLPKEVSLDMDGKGSVLALMSEEYAEEDEISSFTDEEDATSHSSLSNFNSFVENDVDLLIQRRSVEKSQTENVSETALKVDSEEGQTGSSLIAKKESFIHDSFLEECDRLTQSSPIGLSIDPDVLVSGDLGLIKSHRVCLEAPTDIPAASTTCSLPSHHEQEQELETTSRSTTDENIEVQTNFIGLQTEHIVYKDLLKKEINVHGNRTNTLVSNSHLQELNQEQRAGHSENSGSAVKSKESDCNSEGVTGTHIKPEESCKEENDNENGSEEDQRYHSYSSPDRFSALSFPSGEHAQAVQQHEHLIPNTRIYGGDVLEEGKSNGSISHASRRNLSFSVRSPPCSLGSNGNTNSNQCLVDVNEISIPEDTSNCDVRHLSSKSTKDAAKKSSRFHSLFSDKKIHELEYRVEMLEGELREAAAMEMGLYSVVAEHGSSMHKIHTPARRLSRLYLYASKFLSGERRAGAARSVVSGLFMVAKSGGNDIPRLTFWLSNVVVLRAIVSHAIEQSENQKYSIHSTADKCTGTTRNDKRSSLKWESKEKFSFNKDHNYWDNPQTFTAALEKVEAWIFTRIVESVWWQTFIPYMQYPEVGGESKYCSQWKKVFEREFGLDEKIQKSYSFDIWKKAFNNARERLCPLRAEGHECGCLPMLAKKVMEQCVARFDLAMFNAILRSSDDETSTNPVSSPVIDHNVLPIPPGKSSFGAGAQLKNAIGNWSRSLTDLFGMDVDDSSSEKNDEYDENVDVTASPKPFHLLNALSDVFMIPKHMLLEEKVRNEVCPALSPSVIKRILSSFFPDEFCPELVPKSVFEALDSEDQNVKNQDGMIRNLPCNDSPIIYSPPPLSSIKKVIGDGESTSQLKRSRSSVFRKCHASDDELEEFGSPSSAIISDNSSSSSVKENEETGRNSFRYRLLRDVWKFDD